jgi:hypothetical protein
MVLSCLLLNILGYKAISHVGYLEADAGLAKLMKHIERHNFKYYLQSKLKIRWRQMHCREFPSVTTLFNYLKCYHDEQTMENHPSGAYIPPLSNGLTGLLRVLKDLVQFAQQKNPVAIATIDQDATISPSGNQNAYYCYKGYKGYQPINSYWFEQGLLVHSEFRDGNVPACFEVLRILKESLEQLPDTVKTVCFRADGAGYQKELIHFCDSGESRFGMIHYAVSAEISAGFKEAAMSIPEKNWHDLTTMDAYGNVLYNGQQWAEVPYVPGWFSHRKSNPVVRFVAIREPWHSDSQSTKSHELPLPTCEMRSGHYKLFGVASNRYKMPGNELIHWHRQRCGHAEDLHKEQKNDLACLHMPSKYFGTNAAWWLIMVIAFNLEKIIQSLLPEAFQQLHMNTLRKTLINIPAKVVYHSRRLLIKLDDGAKAIRDTLIILRHAMVVGGGHPDPPRTV